MSIILEENDALKEQELKARIRWPHWLYVVAETCLAIMWTFLMALGAFISIVVMWFLYRDYLVHIESSSFFVGVAITVFFIFFFIKETRSKYRR